jgi:capping protein alpha
MSGFNDEPEEISNEEKLTIAQHFLLSAPPGQFGEIRSDVSKLLPEDLLTDALAGGMARASNLKNSKVCTTPSGKKTVLHLDGEVDATHYIDPSTSAVFQVDHLTLDTVEDTSVTAEIDESTVVMQASLQGAIEKYVSSCYLSENSAGGVFVKDGKYKLVITGEKINLKNYWGGTWNSVWSLELSLNSTYKLSGEVKIQVHYFEDGNLQLNSSKPVVPTEGKFSSESDLCEQLFRYIRTQETSIQTGLEEMYNSMSEQTLRSMRRVMPITRTKMEWNINAVRMNSQLHK